MYCTHIICKIKNAFIRDKLLLGHGVNHLDDVLYRWKHCQFDHQIGVDVKLTKINQHLWTDNSNQLSRSVPLQTCKQTLYFKSFSDLKCTRIISELNRWHGYSCKILWNRFNLYFQYQKHPQMVQRFYWKAESVMAWRNGLQFWSYSRIKMSKSAHGTNLEWELQVFYWAIKAKQWIIWPI